MPHSYVPPKQRNPQMSIGLCKHCGKSLYTSRKAAKKAAREMSMQNKSAYRCPQSDECWHFGSLPKSVVRGVVDRAEIRSANHFAKRPNYFTDGLQHTV